MHWNKELKVILAYVELEASLGYRRPSLNKQTNKSKTKRSKVKSYFQNSLFYGRRGLNLSSVDPSPGDRDKERLLSRLAGTK